MEGPAQRNQQVDVGGGRQWRRLGAQMGHPAEDVGIAAQLRERPDLGMMAAEIDQEVADGPAVVASRVGIERGAERLDGAVEGSQPTDVEAEVARAVHDRVPRQGPDVLGHGARILEVDVLRSDLHIDQRGLDIGVPHQVHERGQADAGPHHV